MLFDILDLLFDEFQTFKGVLPPNIIRLKFIYYELCFDKKNANIQARDKTPLNIFSFIFVLNDITNEASISASM